MIRLGDGVNGLDQGLKPGSVDLVLSDLPSGETQAEFDDPPDFERLWPAVWKALKPGGVVAFMASSLHFACVVKSWTLTEYFRYDLVWSKSVATGFLNAKHRPLRTHEFILVFARGKHTYRPQMMPGATPIHAARRKAHGANYGVMTKSTKSRAGATDRYPTSVLEFGSVGTSSKERTHPQQKPIELLRWLVRTYSNPGDLVVDPYAGSGSCEKAALAEGRRFVGWDINPKYGRTT